MQRSGTSFSQKIRNMRMIFNRFYLAIAAGVGCLGFHFNHNTIPALASQKDSGQSLLVAQVEPNQTTSDVLQIGSEGEAVKTLQKRLQALGYFQGEVNSIYGEDTKQALLQFQKSQGLAADGIATPSLQARLQVLLFENYMSQGYSATDQKDYQTALAQFRKAEALNPNSIYVQQAIANVEKYIKREKEKQAQTKPQKTTSEAAPVSTPEPEKSELEKPEPEKSELEKPEPEKPEPEKPGNLFLDTIVILGIVIFLFLLIYVWNTSSHQEKNKLELAEQNDDDDNAR